MNRHASLLSILLLSSALFTAGCTNNADPGRNIGRQAEIPPNGAGRAGVMNIDQRTTDQPNANQTALHTNDAAGSNADQSRLALLGQNARVDSNLSTRVARISGIRSATVLVAGDSAFVMVATGGNQGTSEPSRPRVSSQNGAQNLTSDNPRAGVKQSIERQQQGGARVNDTGGSTIYISDTLESDVKARVSDEIIRTNPAIHNVYFVNRWR